MFGSKNATGCTSKNIRHQDKVALGARNKSPNANFARSAQSNLFVAGLSGVIRALGRGYV